MPNRPAVETATFTPRWAWATASSLRAQGLPFSPVGGYSGRGRRGGKGKPRGSPEGIVPPLLSMLATHDASRMNLRVRERWPSPTDPVPAGRDTSSEQPAERWPVGIPYKGREKRRSRKLQQRRA